MIIGGSGDTRGSEKAIEALGGLLGVDRASIEGSIEDIKARISGKYEKLQEAIPPADYEEGTVYNTGDRVRVGTRVFESVADNNSSNPLHASVKNEEGLPVPSENWKEIVETGEIAGTGKTEEELLVDRLTYLRDAKTTLVEILTFLDEKQEENSEINVFNDTGSQGITLELIQKREANINEIENLRAQVAQLIIDIDTSLIQATAIMNKSAIVNHSIRTKGTTLMLLQGEFGDTDSETNVKVDIKENTSITIKESSIIDASGQSRQISSISNSTVAIIDTPFDPDLDTPVTPSQYTLTQFEGFTNSISTYLMTSEEIAASEYLTLPPFGPRKPSITGPDGTVRSRANLTRTLEDHPTGTILRIYESTWGSIGIIEDDLIKVGNQTRLVIDVISDEFIAIDRKFVNDLNFQKAWDIETTVGKTIQKLQDDKKQRSFFAFDEILEEVQEKADIHNSIKNIFSRKTWPDSSQ